MARYRLDTGSVPQRELAEYSYDEAHSTVVACWKTEMPTQKKAKRTRVVFGIMWYGNDLGGSKF